MRFIILILMVISSFSFSQEIKLKPEVVKKLNIKTEKVKYGEFFDYKIFPAEVKEDPSLSLSVSSTLDGVVDDIYVKEGDDVKKGQILLRIYSPTVVNIQSNIEMAKVKLKASKDVLEREEMLYKEEVIPYVRYYNAKIEYEKNLGEYNALVKMLNSYGEVSDGKVILRSRVNGYVSDLKVIKGSSVRVAEEIMKVHSHERLWIIGQLPYETAFNLKKGQKVKVVSPTGQDLEGIISLINHDINPKTRRNDIRVVVNNPKENLKPNMFVNIKVPVSRDKGLMVNSVALFKENGKTFCFVKENDSFKLKEVKVEGSGKYLKVVSGLNEGDEVVIDGVLFLKTEIFGGLE